MRYHLRVEKLLGPPDYVLVYAPSEFKRDTDAIKAMGAAVVHRARTDNVKIVSEHHFDCSPDIVITISA